MKIMITWVLSLLIVFNIGCNNQEASEIIIDEGLSYAVVEKVTVSDIEGSYTFSVTLKSPDKGCSQYANWWEVVSLNEELIYRRILGHSHVNEQPFTRSGGTVKINATDVVIIRGHMNTTGYGEGKIAMKGSAKDGFNPYVLAKYFANSVEIDSPQPSGCAF